MKAILALALALGLGACGTPAEVRRGPSAPVMAAPDRPDPLPAPHSAHAAPDPHA